MLDTAGYTDSVTQADLLLGYAGFQFCFALLGARFVDRIGRRPLMLFSMTGCCIVWIAVTASTGIFAGSGQTNDNAARSTVAFIFLFGAIYSFGLTPLQALYPVEILSFEMRAKGMAFSTLAVNAAGLLNQFAWPVALANIGWKTYIIFIVWCAIQAVIWYFFLPETRQRTVSCIFPLNHVVLAYLTVPSWKSLTKYLRQKVPSNTPSKPTSLLSIVTTKSLALRMLDSWCSHDCYCCPGCSVLKMNSIGCSRRRRSCLVDLKSA